MMYFMMHEDSGKLLGSFNVAFLFSSLYILASSIKPAYDIRVCELQPKTLDDTIVTLLNRIIL